MTAIVPVHAAMHSFYTFRLGARLYGIDVLQVREVVQRLAITPVPQASAAVCGLFNLRSRIYLGLDMKILLGMPATEAAADNRVVILKPAVAQDVGILVERGGDIIHAPADTVEQSTAAGAAGEDTDLVTRVCKHHAELILVVDAVRATETISRLIR